MANANGRTASTASWIVASVIGSIPVSGWITFADTGTITAVKMPYPRTGPSTRRAAGVAARSRRKATTDVATRITEPMLRCVHSARRSSEGSSEINAGESGSNSHSGTSRTVVVKYAAATIHRDAPSGSRPDGNASTRCTTTATPSVDENWPTTTSNSLSTLWRPASSQAQAPSTRIGPTRLLGRRRHASMPAAP